MAKALVFDRVDFSYETLATPLFQSLSFHLTSGWTGIVGANGIGKTTLLKLSAGLLSPDAGHLRRPEAAAYSSQRTENRPEGLLDFLESYDRDAAVLRDRLEIGEHYHRQWFNLSHGERKRTQIAEVLWRQPVLLAMDEPTNHLDLYATRLISSALQAYSGIGMLVSHDRELLDALCRQCLFLDSRGIHIRPGGVTKGKRILDAEAAAEDRKYRLKKQESRRLKKEINHRKSKAADADKKRSKKGLALKDHDARAKKDAARLTGKDGKAGVLQRQLSGRLRIAEKELSALRYQKETASGIWIKGEFSPKNAILTLVDGSLSLGPAGKLFYPDLSIAPADRIALTGQNGFGKSTFLKHIVRFLSVSGDRVMFLPQEIDAQTARNTQMDAHRLTGEELGRLMTIVSRLGSAPRRLLDSRQPSPGETRKLMLAMGMLREPHIIMMDEPTNHMDLLSIECLEAALAECPCCLLLVSHDVRFLNHLTNKKWMIEPHPSIGESYCLIET
ncbi:MAG: ABC-F family ATP-binding cassette domain-containing protein [Desulfobacteraceae bacterium]|nr:ABC-F family ATP-binding cassette domain-containing protein [Desulfobacteraceae bacterium]